MKRPPEVERPASPLRIEVTAKTMVLAAIVVGGAWVALRLVPVLLVVVVALFLVGTLGPAVEWLEKKGVKRSICIGIAFVAMLITVLGILALTIPTLVE